MSKEPNKKISHNPTQKQNFTSKLSTEDKVAYIGLIIIIFLIYLIRSKFSNIPFERDEGAYTYYGKMLLDGGIPYKDFYEQKFPGVFYFFAMIITLFGSSVPDLHFGFSILNIATIIFLFFATKKIFNPIAAVITSATFAFVSLTPMISGFTIQSEHGVAFFSALGIMLYANAKQTKKWYWYFAMGCAMGCAFMVKTSGVFMVFWGGLIILIDFIFLKERRLKPFLNSVGSYSLGGFSIIGILFLLVFLKGSFSEMLYWTFDMPKYYVNRVSLDDGLKYFGYTKDAIAQFNKFLWVHALLSVLIIFIKSVTWQKKFFVITLGVLSFLTIVPGYYFYGHYWLQMLPGLSILAGATCYGILELLANRFKLNSIYVKYGYLGVFAILLYSHVTKFKQYYFKPNYELIMRNTYGNNPFPETMEVAKYMNNIAKPEDQIAVLGSEPEFFIYTGKKAPSRHLFFSTIVADVPQHKEWQREYAKDIEKAKPKYLLYYNIPISLLVQPNTDKYIFDWANKFITENYQIIGVVDMIPGQHAAYYWKEQLNTYKPQSQEQIYIYERKQ